MRPAIRPGSIKLDRNRTKNFVADQVEAIASGRAGRPTPNRAATPESVVRKVGTVSKAGGQYVGRRTSVNHPVVVNTRRVGMIVGAKGSAILRKTKYNGKR